MKKTLLFYFLMLSSLFFANTITVGASGSDYTTIQAAVNASSAGDIIMVNNGTYNESVDLSLAAGNLTIRATNNLGATVNGGVNPAFAVSTLKTANFEISGFNLNANTGMLTGVLYFVNLDGNLIVKNNVFVSGFGGNAIQLENSSANMSAFIHNNTASSPFDNKDFIKFTNTGGNVNLVVDSNIASGFQDDAVEVSLEASNATAIVRVTNNTFTDWIASGQGIDIFCGGGTAPTNLNVHFIVDNNVVSNTDGDSILINADGINTRIYGAITNNIINGNANTGDGINLDGDSTSNGVHVYLAVEGNTINNVAGNGINFRPFADDAMRDVWNLLINNNTINNPNTDNTPFGTNPEAGIRLDQSSGVDDENYDINIEVTNNSIINLNGNTRCISIEQPTTTLVATAVVNLTQSGNSCVATIEGTVNTVADAVSSSSMPTNIGNRIWFDANYNGIQDGGEVGVAGARVRLVGGGFDMTAVSDANGTYLFPALLAGTYTMTLTGTAAYPDVTLSNLGTDAVDSDFDTTSGQFIINLLGGVDNLTVDGGILNIALSSELFSNNDLIYVYPNPVKDNLMIQSNNLTTILKVNVYNSIGQLVITKDLSLELEPINLSYMNSGIYFVNIISENKNVKTFKIIKE